MTRAGRWAVTNPSSRSGVTRNSPSWQHRWGRRLQPLTDESRQVPRRLHSLPCGAWDPAEEYWGEDGDEWARVRGRPLEFDSWPREALQHYEIGVRIGELSLGQNFAGVLWWGLVDNRPFLRCMKGYGLCLWRLGRADAAASVFDRLLWLNPGDSQGIRFLLAAIRDGRIWEDFDS